MVAARAAAKAKGARDKKEFEKRLYMRMTRPMSRETLGTLKDTLRFSESEGNEEEEDEQETVGRILGELKDFEEK